MDKPQNQKQPHLTPGINPSGPSPILRPLQWPRSKTFWKTQQPIPEVLASPQACCHSILFWCEVQGLQSLAQICGADIPDLLWEREGGNPPLRPTTRSTGSGQEALDEPAGKHPLPAAQPGLRLAILAGGGRSGWQSLLEDSPDLGRMMKRLGLGQKGCWLTH